MILDTVSVLMTFLSNAPIGWHVQNAHFYMPKSSSEAQYLEGRQNLLKLMQEIPLTDDEQAAVENDIQAVDKLLNKLTGGAPPGNKRK